MSYGKERADDKFCREIKKFIKKLVLLISLGTNAIKEMKTSLSLSVLIIISVYLPENLLNAAACEEKFDRIAQCFKDKRRMIRAGIRLSQKEQFREFIEWFHDFDNWYTEEIPVCNRKWLNYVLCCLRENDCSLIQTELQDLIQKDEAAREDLKAEIDTMKTRLYWKFAKDTGKDIVDVGSALFSLLG